MSHASTLPPLLFTFLGQYPKESFPAQCSNIFYDEFNQLGMRTYLILALKRTIKLWKLSQFNKNQLGS